MYACPKGHDSSEPDFCSECGAKIAGSGSFKVATPVPQRGAISALCPACGAPHDAGTGVFCEICGYNFSTGAHGEVKPVEAPEPPPPPAPAPPPPPTPVPAAPEPEPEATPLTAAAPTWTLEITVDPTLRTPDSPEAPTHQATATVVLTQESNLIGRVSERRAIHPEISLDSDDAVSHRHAILKVTPEGTLLLRDIGSSNGTRIRGIELKPMVDSPLLDGDEFTLGHWTRVKVRQT